MLNLDTPQPMRPQRLREMRRQSCRVSHRPTVWKSKKRGRSLDHHGSGHGVVGHRGSGHGIVGQHGSGRHDLGHAVVAHLAVIHGPDEVRS